MNTFSRSKPPVLHRSLGTLALLTLGGLLSGIPAQSGNVQLPLRHWAPGPEPHARVKVLAPADFHPGVERTRPVASAEPAARSRWILLFGAPA